MSEVLRSLREVRTSGASAVAILTMAVAIAANTAIFSVYDQLVLHPVSMPDPASLLAVWFNNPQQNVQAPSMSFPRYERLRTEVSGLTSIAASAFDSFTLTGDGDPVQLNALRVSASFFPTLGIMPARGRNFTETEDVPNGPQVCIISWELWQNQFGGRELIGSTIQLGGVPWEVVGIMPPRLTAPFRQVQVFAPRIFDVGGLTKVQIDAGATFVQAVGRLKPGVSTEQLRLELAQFSRNYEERHPRNLDAKHTSEPRPIASALVNNVAPAMNTLLGASACVLLIACANVTALFFSRMMKRRKDVAIRLCLGATRRTLVARFLIESATIAACAAIIGTLLAVAALKALRPVLASQLPPNTELTLNWRALLFAAAIAAITALITGIWPAARASRNDMVEHLKDASRGSSRALAHRSRQFLVVTEVALSVALLIGAGLLLSSFMRLQNTDGGFTSDGVASSFVAVRGGRYATPAQQLQFYEEVVATLRTESSVTESAVALSLPPVGFARTPYAVAGRPAAPGAQLPLANLNIVSERYFNVLGIRLLEGRLFDGRDLATSPQVCVVNETLARGAFPGESAVGKVLVTSGGTRRVEIVGIVRDVKTAGLTVPAPEELYFPVTQLPRQGLNVIAKTTGDPAGLQAVIRRAVLRTDSSQATSFFATLDTTIANTLGTQQLMAVLTVIFSGVALCLSVIGLYSVLAHLVAQRTAEIGIRMALGASRTQVIAMVLQSAGALVTIGLVLGLAIAAALSGVLRRQLFEVDPLDPGVYAAVVAVFVAAAALACLAPSLRASRVDPAIAFRTE